MADDDSRDPGSYSPATPRQKLVTGVLVLIFSATVVAGWLLAYVWAETTRQQASSVPWVAPAGVTLAPGPPNFLHDQEGNELIFRGPMEPEVKAELLALVFQNGRQLPASSERAETFRVAVDELAFQSHARDDVLFGILMFLGGVSGMLGVQLRSLSNFVGVACFKDKLDVRRWWPWYVLRPVEGFMFGVVAVLLVEEGLLGADSTAPSRPLAGVVVAVLAGFATLEFSARLRDLSKTLFGSGS